MSRQPHRRGPWLGDEDTLLLKLVAGGGPNNWVQISHSMYQRTPKQCRERYHQNLKATLNHAPISVEEGEVIEQLVAQIGKKWAEIARRLGDRSDNAVKNWWNGSQNRKKRFLPSHAQSSKTLVNRTEPIPVMGAASGRQHNRRHGHSNSMTRPQRAYPTKPQPLQNISHSRDIWDDQVSPMTMRRFGSGDISANQLHQLNQDSLPSPARVPSHFMESRGPTLPPLGPIDTNITSTYTPTTLQPPLSASSAPSLVSDHNSVYSISPRTWPSPRPDMPFHHDSIRGRWPEGLQFDRRTSAPSISHLVSPTYMREDGRISGIRPTTPTESKYYLPQPMSRSASMDSRPRTPHQQHPSISTINLSPATSRTQPGPLPSPTKDSRMRFSSLLN